MSAIDKLKSERWKLGKSAPEKKGAAVENRYGKTIKPPSELPTGKRHGKRSIVLHSPAGRRKNRRAAQPNKFRKIREKHRTRYESNSGAPCQFGTPARRMRPAARKLLFPNFARSRFAFGTLAYPLFRGSGRRAILQRLFDATFPGSHDRLMLFFHKGEQALPECGTQNIIAAHGAAGLRNDQARAFEKGKML